MPPHHTQQTCYSVIIGGKIHDVTGRKRTPAGYVALCIRSHPQSDKINGYIFEHRVAMEIKLGRYLDRSEVIHHVNEVKHDNRLENLVLMNRGAHTVAHHLGIKRSDETKGIMSRVAKERFVDKTKHPAYKNIEKNELFRLVDEQGPTKAAAALGVSRKTVYNKLKQFNYEKGIIKS